MMKMYSGLQCLIGLSLALIVKSQTSDLNTIDPQALCSPCKNRGSCDVAVVGECTQYYSCRMVDNNWYFVKMNCAHGTHFSEESGGCLKPEDANCPYDPCANKTSGFYKLEGFCRSYWECKSRNFGGISEAHCCPLNQTFSQEGKCVDDPTCDSFEECTTLPGEGVLNEVVCPEGKYGAGCRYTCSEHCIGTCDSFNGECSLCAKGWMGSKCMEECRYKSVVDNIYLYMEDVGNGNEIKRACGLGTMFNQDKCICDKDPNYVINKECKPDVEIAFESGNSIKNTIDWKWIGGQFRSIPETVPLGGNVYKVGRFDGTKANLYIPFYNRNSEMRKQFATEILFNPDNGKGEKEQILLSNCQSANNQALAPFEIKLLKDTQDIQINVEGVPTEANNAVPASFSITMKYKPDDWNKLEVVFNGAKSALTARNMDLSGGVISEGSTAVQNFLENGLDLRIGWCPEKGYFVGKMAMVRTYLCEPQFELDAQPAADVTGIIDNAPADVAAADVAAADVAVTDPAPAV